MRRLENALVLACALANGLRAQGPAASLASRESMFFARASDGTRVDASNATILKKVIALDLREALVTDALDRIARESGLVINYSRELIPVGRRVTLSAKEITVASALTSALIDANVDVEISEGPRATLVPRAPLPPGRQQRSEMTPLDTAAKAMVPVSVTDDTTKQPLRGVVVGVKGTKIQATTGAQGDALLSHVPSGSRVITARFLGYTPEERRVIVPDSGFVTVRIGMRMGMAHLQEVVTTATGPQRRYEIANDITILNVDSLVATQPISTVTEILEGRVTGLIVQHTSGAPGDPSRLRLRGISSAMRSNDPIVIVDGIRVSAAQSDTESANLATVFDQSGKLQGNSPIPYAAPSPLDEIDPESIQTIEVLKGPSAATLYGPDAANGVIVITTKRGTAGPARWTASAAHGVSTIPGNFPLGYYRWGTNYGGYTVLCPLTDFTCKADSLVRFQALNHARYTVLRQGATSSASVGVSGGSTTLTYAITGSSDDQTGMVGLPGLAVDNFRLQHDGENPLSWMRHPEQFTRWNATTQLTANLNDHITASLSVALDRSNQQHGSLERELTTLMTTYIDPKPGQYWRMLPGGFGADPNLVPDFFTRVTDAATNFRNGGTVSWRPWSWLSTNVVAGLDVHDRQDDMLRPPGLVFGDSLGEYHTGRGTDVQKTVNVGATATLPLLWDVHMQLSTGVQYTNTSSSVIGSAATGLPSGDNSLVGAAQILYATQTSQDITSDGWYIEPNFTVGRYISITTGLRLDQSSTFGKNAHQPVFPKVGVSWLVSEEPFFPFKKFVDTFRPRLAYGAAGVWPGPADRLRLYNASEPWLDGGFQPATQVRSIGNSQLRPERGNELETGFDTDLFRDWIRIGFTYSRKMQYDAIMQVPVAPSVYGSNVTIEENVGVIRNTSFEADAQTYLLRTDPVSWSVALNVSSIHNRLVKLAPGVQPFGDNFDRVTPGYPLFGRWARPILSYYDANHNGIIEPSEVLVGDSLVYMGSQLPDYTGGLSTDVSLFRGAVTATAAFTYSVGITQVNGTIGTAGQLIFSPGSSDPHAPLGQQAAIAALSETDYGVIQTVNELRFSSFSLAYHVPSSIARWLFRASSLSVALQGTNLALFTNYKGKDPNVNSIPTGNSLADNGVVPLPRVWILTVHTTF